MSRLRALGCSAVLALALTSAPALAEEEANDKVSGSVGVSYNSHFISYGLDVWGGGTEFFGSESTMFMWSDITFDLSPFNLTFGVWGDINNNTISGTGGGIQEVDVWAGVSVDVGRFNLGVTFQQWYYASDTEGILDLSIAFDDSDLLPISLSPSLTWHFRIEGNGGQTKSSIIVLAIAPSFDLITSDAFSLNLTIPAGIGLFVDKDFQGGNKSGLGYFYIGGSLSVPLAFISSSFGEWSVNFDVTYYNTSPRAIPGNVKDDFVTGSLGLSVAF
ncbi:MAG: hypothetical protein ACE363_15825 [Alphaproteobacteria bacterium]